MLATWLFFVPSQSPATLLTSAGLHQLYSAYCFHATATRPVPHFHSKSTEQLTGRSVWLQSSAARMFAQSLMAKKSLATNGCPWPTIVEQ